VDFFEKNLRVLEEKFPLLAGKIRALGDSENDTALTIQDAASGEATAVLEGIYLHSARDPVREARRLCEAALEALGALEGAGNGGAFVILGFGLGYAAEAVFSLKSDALVIAVEKRLAVLCAALRCRDFSAMLSTRKLVFVLGDDPSAVNAALQIAPQTAPAKPVIIRNRALYQIDEAYYKATENCINTWRAKDEVNAATLKRFGKRWIKNEAANLAAYRDLPGIALLKARFDFPLLLVAAGPSLDKLRGKLLALAERCVIVAVDTALRFLKQEGVEPDFVASFDPQYWNTRHLDRVLPARSIFISESAVYPSALRRRQKTFLCSSHYPLGQLIEKQTGEKGMLGTGGSVACGAWDFSRFILKPSENSVIFIAGLDLAFPCLQTHYKGSLFEERSLFLAKRFCPAETFSFTALRDGQPFYAPSAAGGKVLTDKRLSLYASWFENRLKDEKNVKSLRVDGGALAIKGLDMCSVEHILSLPARRPEINKCLAGTDDLLYEIWNDKKNQEYRKTRFEKAYNALKNALLNGDKNSNSVMRDDIKSIVKFLPPELSAPENFILKELQKLQL
jgi:hypothetical protein